MNKKVIWIIVAIIVVAGGAWLLYGRNNSTSSSLYGSGSSSNQSSTSSNNSSQSTTNTQTTATDQVSIANFAFSPANITVKKGTKVTWMNNDSTAHTVTESDGKTGPNSQLVNPGSSYSFTYNDTGSYAYHCTIHPQMTGTVTVTD